MKHNARSDEDTLEEMKSRVKKIRSHRWQYGEDPDDHFNQWIIIGSLYRTLPHEYQLQFDEYVY